jgi:hypothetical protein
MGFEPFIIKELITWHLLLEVLARKLGADVVLVALLAVTSESPLLALDGRPEAFAVLTGWGDDGRCH